MRILQKNYINLSSLPTASLNPFPTIHSNLDKRKSHAFTDHYQTCIFNAPMNIFVITPNKKEVSLVLSVFEIGQVVHTIAASRKIETRREKSNMRGICTVYMITIVIT